MKRSAKVLLIFFLIFLLTGCRDNNGVKKHRIIDENNDISNNKVNYTAFDYSQETANLIQDDGLMAKFLFRSSRSTLDYYRQSLKIKRMRTRLPFVRENLHISTFDTLRL